MAGALKNRLCFVVGSKPCVDSVFTAVASAGELQASININIKWIKLNRMARPVETESEGGRSLHTEKEISDNKVVMSSMAQTCNELTLWDPGDCNHPEQMCFFYRCSGDCDSTVIANKLCYGVGKKVLLILHTGEYRDSCGAISRILHDLIGMSRSRFPEASAKVPLSCVTLLLDCSDTMAQFPETDRVKHTLLPIHMAFNFCAYKMLKWTPKLGTLDTLLSVIAKSPEVPLCQTPITFCHFSDITLPVSQPVLVPVIPAILDITCADVITAHMIMQLVHDYRPQFPFFTVSMALRTWVKTRNEAALGVVCLSRSLTESENVDLSDLKLESVPESLRPLTCRTLNLSNNKLKKIPKWLVEMPNVRLGNEKKEYTVNQRQNEIQKNTHKLVIVGDTGVGKTTLLKFMESTKKLTLTTKHTHAIAVHHTRNTTIGHNMTIWDLGGDSLSPLHQWFLLSRSVIILVFDVSKALQMKEPSMAVYRWVNEISFARSRGDKAWRSIIPVGTHMEGIDPNAPNVTDLMNRIFILEDIPIAFLLQLSNGKGWKYEKSHRAEEPRCVYSLLDFIQGEICDGIPQSVPQTWIALNKKVIQRRDKRRCGMSKALEIELCANFLADIGTIVHFRYPFWLLSHAVPIHLPELVIVEPYSFLAQLQKFIITDRQEPQNRKNPSMNELGSLLVEFGDVHKTLSNFSHIVKGHRSFLPLVHTIPPAILKQFHADISLTAPVTSNGRSIKLPLLPHDLFFKAISSISRSLLSSGWVIKFCWRDALSFSYSCSHGGSEQQVLLFITFQDDMVSIYLRSECNEHPQQEHLWASLMGTLYNLSQSRFEEESGAPFPGVIELFPCPHCLMQGNSSPDKWTDNDKPSALPSNLFYFHKEHILNAVKNGQHKLTCENGNCEVDLVSVAPNIVALHRDTTPSESEIKIPGSPRPIIPPAIGAIIGSYINIDQCISLGELLTSLIRKGNGTTSILDRVLPISSRLKILKDVAQALDRLHNGPNSPNVHTKISPDNIIVLSLDESGPGPWAKIKAPHTPVTLLFGSYCMPASTPISPEDVNFCAPEVLSGLTFDTKADVWGFGKPNSHISLIPSSLIDIVQRNHSIPAVVPVKTAIFPPHVGKNTNQEQQIPLHTLHIP
ncbi:hypothetical protein Pelo_11000 [Pelomyxa schiedti]|nr:hypothetical protein Pelo_11000 [Pelomyxa schiedti]